MPKTKTPKLPKLPPELDAFIKQGGTTLHCDDGDWELCIESREDAEIGDELPVRSTVIAENGCGDFLFLRASPAGKFDPKVFVYWHEESRHEAFAKSIAALITESAKSPAVAKQPAVSKKTIPLAEIEKARTSKDPAALKAILKRLSESDFGAEALPVLRMALSQDDVNMVLRAAELIGKIGPEALKSPVAERSAEFNWTDLEGQLMREGGKTWSYSGYANCYSTCLNALMKLQGESEWVVEFIQTHIGLGNPDDLLASLQALHDIGTDESIDLLKRAATFWLPELNLAQTNKVKALVATARKAKKK